MNLLINLLVVISLLLGSATPGLAFGGVGQSRAEASQSAHGSSEAREQKASALALAEIVATSTVGESVSTADTALATPPQLTLTMSQAEVEPGEAAGFAVGVSNTDAVSLTQVVVSVVLPEGLTATGEQPPFDYDALNRLKGKTYSTRAAACAADPGYSGYTVKYYYAVDENGNAVSNGKGRRTVMIDSSGSAKRLYGQRGKATQETKVIGGTGGGTFVTQWTYDAADRVKTMVYPGSPAETVTYTYNPQGLVETAVGTSTYVSSMTYNALGQATERWLGSNGVVRQHFDYTAAENFRLAGLQSGVSPDYNTLQNLSYTYDDADNVLAITDAAAVGGSQTQTFTYDALNRLATATASGTPPNYGAYNQVSYSYNSALRYTNPTGYRKCDDAECTSRSIDPTCIGVLLLSDNICQSSQKRFFLA